MANYLWNVRLSEALYPALQCLEVAIRNSLHNAATDYFGTDFWFDVAGLLDIKGVEMVASAKRELAVRRRPLEAGRIVAELRFGFWTSLLNVHYEHQQRLWPHLLRSAFPFTPRTLRTRRTISGRLNEIRDLRNRIFHHERISHYDLVKEHRELMFTLGWVSPELEHLAKSIDRFPEIHAGGWRHTGKEIAAKTYPVDFSI